MAAGRRFADMRPVIASRRNSLRILAFISIIIIEYRLGGGAIRIEDTYRVLARREG